MLSASQIELIQRIQKQPTAIREIFAQFHASSEPLADELLDSLLDIVPDPTERTINRQNLDHSYGVEQYTYEGTPYDYIRWFLHTLDPQPTDVVYDLGSGYGRVGLYGALTTPARYVGIEIVPERVTESQAIARRFGIKNTEFHQGHIFEYDISDGTIFFLFNPFIERTFRQTMAALQKIAERKWIRIVAWGGGNTVFLFDQPWLHELTAEQDTPTSSLGNRVHIFESV